MPSEYEAPQSFHRVGDWLVAELQAKGTPAQFAGVLALKGGRGLQFTATPGAVPAAGGLGQFDWQAVLVAVLAAIAGGVLLNLMPCVFPILALKALHVARARRGRAAGADRRALLRRRSGGRHRRAWHCASCSSAPPEPRPAGHSSCRTRARSCFCSCSRLRSPPTCSACSSFPCSADGLQPAGSFATGALAAFVATPCAGPFLGAALGAALALPPAASIAIFAALGLGLGLPFVVLAFVPRLRDKLPKPGRWMDRLKHVLAIPMGLSAIAVAWLLYRLAGGNALISALLWAISLLVLACCARRRAASRPKLRRSPRRLRR